MAPMNRMILAPRRRRRLGAGTDGLLGRRWFTAPCPVRLVAVSTLRDGSRRWLSPLETRPVL